MRAYGVHVVCPEGSLYVGNLVEQAGNVRVTEAVIDFTKKMYCILAHNMSGIPYYRTFGEKSAVIFP